MQHYFDDILHHRHVGSAQTPRTPGALSPTLPRMRRSSTSRSLAARSDYSATTTTTTTDVNGDGDDTQGGYDGGISSGGGGGAARRGSVNAAAGLLYDDPERARARAEADAHLHAYISQQLERVRLDRGDEDGADEFEARV
jgi:hypothetical protein